MNETNVKLGTTFDETNVIFAFKNGSKYLYQNIRVTL